MCASTTATTGGAATPSQQLRTPNTQRKRGMSFLAHCLSPQYMTVATQAHARQQGGNYNGDAVHGGDTDGDSNSSSSSSSGGGGSDVAFRRSPTLSRTDEYLIPAKAEALGECLTVVLDLDETLVYARSGPLYVRPGCEALMSFLAANCETVVWTSSMHHYADAVVAQIDSAAAIHHVVYRHPRWCTTTSSTKDLRLLGRNLDTTIIIENTPDCVAGYEANGVLVGDYDGGELEDKTLTNLLELLTDLVQQHKQKGVTVPAYIASSARVQWRELPSDTGELVGCYCLHTPELDPPSTADAAAYTPHCHHRHHHYHHHHHHHYHPRYHTCQHCAVRHRCPCEEQQAVLCCNGTCTAATADDTAACAQTRTGCGAWTPHATTTTTTTPPASATSCPGAASVSLSSKRHRQTRARVGKGECALWCHRPQPLKKILIC